jgi:hypothetical protein
MSGTERNVRDVDFGHSKIGGNEKGSLILLVAVQASCVAKFQVGPIWIEVVTNIGGRESPSSPRGGRKQYPAKKPGTVRKPKGTLRCNRAASWSSSGLPREASRNRHNGQCEKQTIDDLYKRPLSKRWRMRAGIISLQSLHGSVRPVDIVIRQEHH